MSSSALALSSTKELLDLVSTVFHGKNNLDCVLISHSTGPKDQATDGRRMFQSFSSPSSASDYLALKRQSGCSISLIDAESPDNIGHLLKWPKVLKNHATLLTSPEPPNFRILSHVNHPLLWRPARMVFLYVTLNFFCTIIIPRHFLGETQSYPVLPDCGEAEEAKEPHFQFLRQRDLPPEQDIPRLSGPSLSEPLLRAGPRRQHHPRGALHPALHGGAPEGLPGGALRDPGREARVQALAQARQDIQVRRGERDVHRRGLHAGTIPYWWHRGVRAK